VSSHSYEHEKEKAENNDCKKDCKNVRPKIVDSQESGKDNARRK
jgi:hypothetical protein